MDEDDFFDRINRILRPEGAAEMGAFLGASMLPGIGESIDVADILMGLRERDAQRIGFGALGLALPFVAGGTLRRIAGGSGMDTPPSTVPKTPPKDDLPDGPFSEEELLSMTVADFPAKDPGEVQYKTARRRLGERERELPLILRALARSDDPSVPELEREHLEMFWDPTLGDYDRSAHIGAFMDQWEESGLVDSITDLDFEEALQVFRHLNAVARETIPQRVADLLENPIKTYDYGAGRPQKVDPTFSGPRKFRVYRSDDRLDTPVIGTSPMKSIADFWARRGGTTGKGLYKARKPGIRTFELEPEDVVLDLPGFADEVGATLRFTGEQELMALRDTLARKEIIDSDDFEFLEDYYSAIARIGADDPPAADLRQLGRRKVVRTPDSLLNEPRLLKARPARKLELKIMSRMREPGQIPEGGLDIAGVPFSDELPVRNPRYFADNPFIAAPDLDLALEGTGLHLLITGAADLTNKMTKNLDPESPLFVGLKSADGAEDNLKFTREGLQASIDDMLKYLGQDVMADRYDIGNAQKRWAKGLAEGTHALSKDERQSLDKAKNFITKHAATDDEAFSMRLSLQLKRMSHAHQVIPVYNEMQKLGREVAVAVGESDFLRAKELLKELKLIVNDKDLFKRKILEFGFPDPDLPEIIRRRVGY
tara:strand:- start:54 stop:2021 length:1968 start_codon:yes stop_codon:yes gene_type:complete